MKKKKAKPTICKGDVLLITGYYSLLHHDTFTENVTPKEMQSPKAITQTKKGWVIEPRDLHYIATDRDVMVGEDIPNRYEKKIRDRGYYWELMLDLRRPKR